MGCDDYGCGCDGETTEQRPSFYQWETKGLNLVIIGAEDPLEGWSHVVVSLGQGGRSRVDLHARDGGESDPGINVDVENDTIELSLSQEVTGRFAEGECDVQVNILYHDRERDTTLEGVVEVRHNLYRKVMS